MGEKASGKHHPIVSWAKGLINACTQLQSAERITEAQWQRFLELLKHPNTVALTEVLLKSAGKGIEGELSSAALSHIRSIREPIVHYTDKVRDVWQENALLFKLPESLLVMHRQASRSGADPQHMGLLVVQAIAQAVIDMLVLQQLGKLEIRLAVQDQKQQRVRTQLESERKGFVYAQEYANPAFLARQKALLREYLNKIKAMIERRTSISEQWYEDLLKINQYAAQILQLQMKLSTHMQEIHDHRVAIKNLVNSHITAEALMKNCPEAFRAKVQALAAFMQVSPEDGFKLVAQVLSEEMTVQLRDEHAGLEPEVHFKIAKSSSVTVVNNVLTEVNGENAESAHSNTEEAVLGRINKKISSMSIEQIAEAEGYDFDTSELAHQAFENMRVEVCQRLIDVKIKSQQSNKMLEQLNETFDDLIGSEYLQNAALENDQELNPLEMEKLEKMLGIGDQFNLDFLSMSQGTLRSIGWDDQAKVLETDLEEDSLDILDSLSDDEDNSEDSVFYSP